MRLPYSWLHACTARHRTSTPRRARRQGSRYPPRRAARWSCCCATFVHVGDSAMVWRPATRILASAQRGGKLLTLFAYLPTTNTLKRANRVIQTTRAAGHGD